MYEDEFELTFDTPEEEPVYVPEPKAPPKPKAAPVPPAPEEPTRIMEMSGDAAPAPRQAPAPEPAVPPAIPKPDPVVLAAPAHGRCVLISGGDRGIGAAAARAFYAAGYRVAVLYHSNADAAAALEKQLPGVLAVQCDVASRASCELAFRTVEQALGNCSPTLPPKSGSGCWM